MRWDWGVWAVLGLLVLSLGFAVHKQVQVNGEQKEQLKAARAALQEAAAARLKAEDALQVRERELLKIGGEMRSLRRKNDELEKRVAAYRDWRGQPLPAALVEFLRREFGGPGATGVPAGGGPRRAQVASVQRDDERGAAGLGIGGRRGAEKQ